MELNDKLTIMFYLVKTEKHLQKIHNLSSCVLRHKNLNNLHIKMSSCLNNSEYLVRVYFTLHEKYII